MGWRAWILESGRTWDDLRIGKNESGILSLHLLLTKERCPGAGDPRHWLSSRDRQERDKRSQKQCQGIPGLLAKGQFKYIILQLTLWSQPIAHIEEIGTYPAAISALIIISPNLANSFELPVERE